MLLAFILVMQAAPAAAPRESPPVLQFPTPGLDDPAAYEGYTARVFRDSRGNAVEIYIEGKTGRVVHLWADGLNESIGFTVRDSGGQGGQEANAAVAFGAGQVTVGATGGRGGRAARRWLRYSLTVPGGRSTQIGQILLGSMRIERDFGYAGRVRDSINASPFVPQEFTALARRLGGAYPSRVIPLLSLTHTGSRWRAQAYQPSLDAKNHMWLTISGDSNQSHARLSGRALTIRASGAEPVELLVEIATDGPALDPLDRKQIFNEAFRHFA